MTKNAEFYYFSLADDMPRKDKLHWFDTTKFKDIPFERIHPDDKGNWLNLTDNDFDSLMPVCDKEVKAGKSKENNAEAIFKLYSLGVVTSRDEWVYDYNKQNLENKVKFFFDIYNSEIKRWEQSTENEDVTNFVDRTIKWTSELEAHLTKSHPLTFDKNCVISSSYRPFIKQFFYFDKIITHRIYQNEKIFGFKNQHENVIINFRCVAAEQVATLASNKIVDLALLKTGNGVTQCLPLYIYDTEGKPQENITNWAWTEFKTHYGIEVTKMDIFHYVYAVLHNPVYREKYEHNLKRELPRVPFYDDFSQWVEWGKTLMALHLNYETVEPYPLKRVDSTASKIPKAKLKADKINGVIELDENTSLSGIPAEAWNYKLGNRSALEWILDQYKEKKPKDATIAANFNVYRFADYKETVIDLLMRVCNVSILTVEIIKKMEL
ncbi:MAG: type ISP restriction/modification enzyme [Methylococcaceae bacterium]